MIDTARFNSPSIKSRWSESMRPFISCLASLEGAVPSDGINYRQKNAQTALYAQYYIHYEKQEKKMKENWCFEKNRVAKFIHLQATID